MQAEDKNLENERWELLEHIDELFKKPLIALSFIWLILIILELTEGISPTLLTISYIIWIIFIVDFIIEFVIAPKKERYLRKNLLVLLSLVVPAIRIFRIFRGLRILRATRITRSVVLARLLTSVNRGMRATRATLGQRKLGFVTILTIIVALAGAAGITNFENTSNLRETGITGIEGLDTYGDALWWSTMILTTIGSEYWPQTIEGRILTVILSIYAFAVFGYITAAIASILVGKDIKRDKL